MRKLIIAASILLSFPSVLSAGDFYALSGDRPDGHDVWCAYQLDRPRAPQFQARLLLEEISRGSGGHSPADAGENCCGGPLHAPPLHADRTGRLVEMDLEIVEARPSPLFTGGIAEQGGPCALPVAEPRREGLPERRIALPV